MVKFTFLLIVSVVLVVGGHSGFESSSNSGSDSSSRCEKSKKCPFKVKSDLVTLEDFKQKVVDEVWIGIFSSKFSANQSFGRKCNFRWNATDSDSGIAELFCYSLRTNKCENFSLTTIKTEDECGRIQENDVNSAAVAKLYSQDPDQYLWHDVCYRFNIDGECVFRYLDLLVKKWRGISELDLNGLPLHLIAIDMKTNFNLEFSGEIGQFSLKEGPEGKTAGYINKTAKYLSEYITTVTLTCMSLISDLFTCFPCWTLWVASEKTEPFNMEKQNKQPPTETDSDGTEGENSSNRALTSNIAFPRFL